MYDRHAISAVYNAFVFSVHCQKYVPQARSFEKDILVQITAIELLPSVASCLGGLGYLCSQGMVDWLVRASSAEADPFISGEV